MFIGYEFQTVSSGPCKVVEMPNLSNVVVEFEDGFRKTTTASVIRKGNIKNPYYPSVQGVGFLGEGPFITSKGRILTQESVTWRGMLQRCYDAKFLIKHPTYSENHVNPLWHNFQNFAKWCQTAKGFKNNWCLDKDVVTRGNKEYGPDFCCFIPHEINNLFVSNKVNRGVLPIGVSWNKNKKKYSSSCHSEGKQVEIGFYDNPSEAFMAYKQFKESRIKFVAEKWKNDVDRNVYESLLNWEVCQDD